MFLIHSENPASSVKVEREELVNISRYEES